MLYQHINAITTPMWMANVQAYMHTRIFLVWRANAIYNIIHHLQSAKNPSQCRAGDAYGHCCDRLYKYKYFYVMTL